MAMLADRQNLSNGRYEQSDDLINDFPILMMLTLVFGLDKPTKAQGTSFKVSKLEIQKG
jgi:hypothetical protein